MTSFTSNCVYDPSILVYIYLPAHEECVTVCEEFTCYLPIWIPARKFGNDWTFFTLYREQIVAFSFIMLIALWLWGKSLRHYKTLQRFLSMPLVDLVTVSGRVRERNNWWSIYYIVRQSGVTITWYVYHDSIFWPTPSSIFKPLAFYTLFWAYLVTIRIFDNLLTWIFTPRYGKFKLPIYVFYLEGFSSFFVFEVILFFLPFCEFYICGSLYW